MLNNFSILFKTISSRRLWQLSGLAILMLIGAFAEMATLGAVVPFLALLADPKVVNNYPLFQNTLSFFGGLGENTLLAAALLFSIVSVGAAILRLLLAWATLRISFGLGGDLGSEVYRHILYKPYSWHVERNSSEVIAGIDKISNIIGGIILPTLQGVVAVVMVIGILTMLFFLDTQTALVAVAGFSLLYGITTLTLRNKLLLHGKNIADKMTQRLQIVQEGLGGIRDVLLDGTQPIFHRRFVQYDSAMRSSQAVNNFIALSPRFIIEALGMVLIVGLAYWLSEKTGGLSGSISVLGALAIGAQKLLPQMQLIYFSWSSVMGNKDALSDVINLIDQKNTVEHSNYSNDKRLLGMDVQHKNIPKPLIDLRKIEFRYKSDTPTVLNEISLQISQGMCIGFIGRTGSGKSTLIDIIMGLLEPTSGGIFIDGIALNYQTRRSWQKRIAHVPQSIYLSDASIAENIAFGIPESEINLNRVKDAALKAQLSDFIESLPDKYFTFVGERGVRLSGGQRQRIGLARALYKKADVLILDEATSALDSNTESDVMNSILELNENLTILIIAHRLTTLEKCHVIVELNDGAINLKSKKLYEEIN